MENALIIPEIYTYCTTPAPGRERRPPRDRDNGAPCSTSNVRGRETSRCRRIISVGGWAVKISEQSLLTIIRARTDFAGNWCYGQGMSALSCSEIQNEPAGMCCASGKVQLPEIETPPEPLNGLLIGTDPDSNVFLKRIVSELDALLNEHNELLKIFKSHMHQLQSDNHAIVINPDKTPAGEHIRRFNAPVVDDVAGIMVGDCTAAREIVIRRRNNNLQFIADTSFI
ncbi:hypothetical protein EVAR_5243_1 [Eumeta japonica]|uniref:Uncharacterized protein n=1 Tax=Eumeta variegata TaxID=151549 RepID=A0A4C1XSD3_EUMVA|nr:hypothetical protein EVAR_5243_1 [Eumeta japonica]